MNDAPVFLVTYPRSGHHALMYFLSALSKSIASDYCEYYKCKGHDNTPISCPKEGLHAREKGFVCGAGRRILKNHDFGLDLPVRQDWKYIVQYRHPIYSIESWYKLERRNGRDMDFLDFFEEKLDFWKKFIERWVIGSAARENVLLMPYEKLGDVDRLLSASRFIGVGNVNVTALGDGYFRPKSGLDFLLPKEVYRDTEGRLEELLYAAGLSPILR